MKSVTGFFSVMFLCAFYSGVTQAGQLQGFDPGMKIANYAAMRKPNSTYNWHSSNLGTYISEAVSEQGAFMDQRPFNVMYSTHNYLNFNPQVTPHGSNYIPYNLYSNEVTPFFFKWRHEPQEPNGKVADLLVDTKKNIYRYRTNPNYSGTLPGRDFARRVYFKDYWDSNGGLKSSLDDGVFFSLREADDQTPGINFQYHTVRTLKHNFKLYWDSDIYHHIPENSGKQAGGRVLATVEWTSGSGRIYLVEMNIGGVSNKPDWQTETAHWWEIHGCMSGRDASSDNNQRRYIIVGSDRYLNWTAPRAQNSNVTIDWGSVLRHLTTVPTDHSCWLPNNALDNIQPNSLKIGVAQEVKGALEQRVSYSRSRIYQ